MTEANLLNGLFAVNLRMIILVRFAARITPIHEVWGMRVHHPSP